MLLLTPLLLLACSSDPLVDELPVSRIEAHIEPDFVDFEFTVAKSGKDCPVMGGLIDARLNGRKPIITRAGGIDNVLQKTTGKVACFTPLVAFSGLSDLGSADIELTLSTRGEPWAITLGDAPLVPRELALQGDVDGRALGGKTLHLQLDPPAPIRDDAEAELGNEYDSLIAVHALSEPQFRVDGARIELDVPEKAGTIGKLRFKRLWAPSISGCPEGVICAFEAKNLEVDVPRKAAPEPM